MQELNASPEWEPSAVYEYAEWSKIVQYGTDTAGKRVYLFNFRLRIFLVTKHSYVPRFYPSTLHFSSHPV